MTIDEMLKQLIAKRDSAIHRLIDYRISVAAVAAYVWAISHSKG